MSSLFFTLLEQVWVSVCEMIFLNNYIYIWLCQKIPHAGGYAFELKIKEITVIVWLVSGNHFCRCHTSLKPVWHFRCFACFQEEVVAGRLWHWQTPGEREVWQRVLGQGETEQVHCGPQGRLPLCPAIPPPGTSVQPAVWAASCFCASACAWGLSFVKSASVRESVHVFGDCHF